MTELITTPFGFSSTAADVLAGVDLGGKRAIVTGGGSGIGVETVRALAAAGAEVTIAVRNPDAATVVDGVRVARLDLADLASVRAFAEAWTGPLHILVNNAGVMALPELELASSGHELQFATNHLGHFALALGLHDALAAADGARIVAVSSSAHQRSPVIFDDLDFRFRIYEPWAAYGQSKTANILFAVEASRRWARDGITANSLNPGAISTNLQRHIGGKLSTPPELQKTPAQGAATSALLAGSSLVAGVAGRYFENGNESALNDRRSDSYHGLAPYAVDLDNANRLWETSMELLRG